MIGGFSDGRFQCSIDVLEVALNAFTLFTASTGATRTFTSTSMNRALAGWKGVQYVQVAVSLFITLLFMWLYYSFLFITRAIRVVLLSISLLYCSFLFITITRFNFFLFQFTYLIDSGSASIIR